MSGVRDPSYRNRKEPICKKIRSLLVLLTHGPSDYDQIAPKIEYWIEYALREDFVTVDELVEGVSYIAWDDGGSFAVVGRFLKEFQDTPHRSEHSRSFVSRLCRHVLLWFAVASSEDLHRGWTAGTVSGAGGNGFIRAASLVGHLIEWGLLNHDLVRRHLVKPLTNHHGDEYGPTAIRANAIYQLLTAAGNAPLQGLFEPEDVQVCFQILDARRGWIIGYSPVKLTEWRETHTAWIQRTKEKKDANQTDEFWGTGEEDVAIAEASAEVKTPVAFAPQDISSATIGIEASPSILRDIESLSSLRGTSASPEASINVPVGTISSPTLSISTISDLTPTELGEEIEKVQDQPVSRHSIFYFEDGNVEISCGNILFRVHSTIVSFSSSKLREILSQSVIDAPTPEGRPRITLSDSAEDFGTLLKMIYTPGFPPRYEVPEFSVFASLLRMTTKYGFSEVRNQLFKDLEGAYPTKWEDFKRAKILGEDVFGSPKPHPNAVLNLLETQNLKFAIPFAAYRASLGGFSALMSDEPGAILSRRTLATTIHGMHVLRSAGSGIARKFAYGSNLRVCPDKACALNVGIIPIKPRLEALGKVYNAITDRREGGVLSPPSLGYLLCATCLQDIGVAYATWASACWETLAVVFNVCRGREDS